MSTLREREPEGAERPAPAPTGSDAESSFAESAPPGAMSPARVMALQRLVGNAAVGRLLDRRDPEAAPEGADAAATPPAATAPAQAGAAAAGPAAESAASEAGAAATAPAADS